MIYRMWQIGLKKVFENASESLSEGPKIQKIFWGSMPPDCPPRTDILCLVQVKPLPPIIDNPSYPPDNLL